MRVASCSQIRQPPMSQVTPLKPQDAKDAQAPQSPTLNTAHLASCRPLIRRAPARVRRPRLAADDRLTMRIIFANRRAVREAFANEGCRTLPVRTQMAIIVQPATFDERGASFPDVTLERTQQSVSYSVSQRKITVRVPLIPDLPWRFTPNGLPEIFLEQLPLVSYRLLAFDLRLWIIFHPPGPAPIPDVRVWCQKMFVPGGQFESNRRRH
jgi:hypothetical protein